MIVDDDKDIRDLLSLLLERNHYQAISAANGQEALDQLHASPVKPCLIILDIMMPVMDGWRFRILQRNDPEISDIPVVALTAHASIEDATRRLLADGALRKPVEFKALLSTIARFCHA